VPERAVDVLPKTIGQSSETRSAPMTTATQSSSQPHKNYIGGAWVEGSKIADDSVMMSSSSNGSVQLQGYSQNQRGVTVISCGLARAGHLMPETAAAQGFPHNRLANVGVTSINLACGKCDPRRKRRVPKNTRVPFSRPRRSGPVRHPQRRGCGQRCFVRHVEGSVAA
jgi:hypothetical protein